VNVRLVIEKGKTRTRTLHLRKAEGLIGRQHGCDFRIASAEVSRRHCVLRVRDGYVTVEDLNSSNGTQLNGEEVEGRQVVRPGDRLRVGPITFIVEYQLTPEAIDRLLRGEAGESQVGLEVVDEVQDAEPADEEDDLLPIEEVEEVQEVEEVEEVEEAQPVVDELEVIDAGDFQLPETEELRDILTGLDEDDEPPKKRKKRK
jgi:pSer/pThr/pTyr-binding forkhead associated (FHA) protein